VTVQHVLSFTPFCIIIYRAGRRLRNVELSCNLFGMTRILGDTDGIIEAVFLCQILISSSVKSVYFLSFSAMCCEGCDCWELLHLLSMLL
jgi:hypothetical protein